MSSRPRRRGGKDKGIILSERRPGLIDKPHPRRTAAEIRAEEAHSAALALEKHAAAERSQSASIARVAAQEDKMQREDEEARRYSARPDLRTPDSPVDQEQEEDLELDSMEQDNYDAPPASTIDTDSDGMALGTEDEQDDFAAAEGDQHDEPFGADGDDEDRDPDYEASGGEDVDVSVSVDMGSDAESESNDEDTNAAWLAFLKTQGKSASEKTKKGPPKSAPKAKPKAKGPPAKKGDLRAKIADSREEAPVAGSSGPKKRKNAVAMEPPPVPKRPKASEIGGLKPQWKKIAMADERGRAQSSKPSESRSSSKSSHMQTGTSEGEYFGGAVDEDEAVVPVPPAAESSGKRSRRGGTAAMGIKLSDVTPEISGPVIKVKKPRYSNDHLPFGVERPEQIKVWQTTAIGMITEWAGSLDDAFSAGASQPEFKAEVRKAWVKCFPDIPCDDAVYGVAASAIRTWRSETGKYTISYFDNLFAKRARELREDTAGRVAFVAAELDGMSFVYADPVNKRGAYRSQAVSYAYARHLRIISVVPLEDRRKQKGALALTTAAVERGLGMWKSGTKFQEPVKRVGRKSALRFVADPWAKHAGTYLKVIAQLSDSKWADIDHLAEEWNAAPPNWDIGEDDDTSEGPDPRLAIELSDDELE
ncbi:hypothetical protein B0H16DRAFT_1893554 [Mycena metata]|uniref:Uncharacterized protein n=1 Tax=Mycena metata TaxID=1033252 RepID=A0AAD7MS49_9AGAR|nr:hypothetical protein B0H16DRAFT_1893554 [Mycena metata]